MPIFRPNVCLCKFYLFIFIYVWPHSRGSCFGIGFSFLAIHVHPHATRRTQPAAHRRSNFKWPKKGCSRWERGSVREKKKLSVKYIDHPSWVIRIISHKFFHVTFFSLFFITFMAIFAINIRCSLLLLSLTIVHILLSLLATEKVSRDMMYAVFYETAKNLTKWTERRERDTAMANFFPAKKKCAGEPTTIFNATAIWWRITLSSIAYSCPCSCCYVVGVFIPIHLLLNANE